MPENQAPEMNFNSVDEDYFRTLEIPTVSGRAFSTSDRKDTLRVAVINESVAHPFRPGIDPIGQRFSVGRPDASPVEVIDVERDSKYASLFEEHQPSFYLPLAQNYRPLRVLQLRTALPPESLETIAVKNIHDLAPNLPVFDVMTMQQSLGGHNRFFLLRIGALFSGAPGVVSLLLAVIGIYVMSFVAAE